MAVAVSVLLVARSGEWIDRLARALRRRKCVVTIARSPLEAVAQARAHRTRVAVVDTRFDRALLGELRAVRRMTTLLVRKGRQVEAVEDHCRSDSHRRLAAIDVIRAASARVWPLDAAIRNHLRAALDAVGGNRSLAAELLDIRRRQLQRLIAKHSLTDPTGSPPGRPAGGGTECDDRAWRLPRPGIGIACDVVELTTGHFGVIL